MQPQVNHPFKEKKEYNDRADLQKAGLNNISNILYQPKFKLKINGAAELDDAEILKRKEDEEVRKKEMQKPKERFNNNELNNILLRDKK